MAASISIGIKEVSDGTTDPPIKNCVLLVEPAGFTDGRKSFDLIVNISDYGEGATIASFLLNRNKARYLCSFLDAFCGENDINPEDED